MPATLAFHSDPSALGDVDTLLVMGRKHRLLAADIVALLPKELSLEAYQAMVAATDATDQPRTATTYLSGTAPRRVVVGALPENCSRHNAPSRAYAVPAIVRAAGKRGPIGLLCALEDASMAFATVTHAASALPSWQGTSRKGEYAVRFVCVAPDGPVTDTERLAHAAEGVRLAAMWVDLPPDELDPDKLVLICKDAAEALPHTSFYCLRGRELKNQGLGGLWAVGRAASSAPALVVLDYAPPGATKRDAWIGKGITYDTGGLCIKARTSMPSMKSDLGGAAAVLAAFVAAARMGYSEGLVAVLCIAENAIGPDAIRPDDIIKLFSGRTVEVNNTDAEGRIVLADGIAWAVRYRDPAVIVDMATLTGAQSIATGKLHGAIYCSDEDYEKKTVEAGRRSGDLVHPLPYAPELYRPEFGSEVADMRNSVKNRNNAQASCAAQFVGDHRGNHSGPWLHVDMAGPVMSAGRGSGYGVALLLALAGLA